MRIITLDEVAVKYFHKRNGIAVSDFLTFVEYVDLLQMNNCIIY
jgi:hypothetical protein